MKEMQELAMQISGGERTLVEQAASAKALRWEPPLGI